MVLALSCKKDGAATRGVPSFDTARTSRIEIAETYEGYAGTGKISTVLQRDGNAAIDSNGTVTKAKVDARLVEDFLSSFAATVVTDSCTKTQPLEGTSKVQFDLVSDSRRTSARNATSACWTVDGANAEPTSAFRDAEYALLLALHDAMPRATPARDAHAPD